MTHFIASRNTSTGWRSWFASPRPHGHSLYKRGASQGPAAISVPVQAQLGDQASFTGIAQREHSAVPAAHEYYRYHQVPRQRGIARGVAGDVPIGQVVEFLQGVRPAQQEARTNCDRRAVG